MTRSRDFRENMDAFLNKRPRNGAVNESLFPSNTGEKSWALWPD